MMVNFKTINSEGNMTRTGGIMSDHRPKQQLPDAKKHQVISFIKSGIRLVGYGALLYDIEVAVYILVFSELIGIVEELV